MTVTKNKNLKTRVRARMAKTGESYTAARLRIVRKGDKAVDYEGLAQMRDATVVQKTGRSWAQWCKELDKAGCLSMSHRDIARHIGERYAHVSPWWAQSLTVGYERIRGLREVGQLCDRKEFSANKSRTFPVPVSTLYRYFSQKKKREAWMSAKPTVRTSRVERTLRLDWPDGTQVAIHFSDKGPNKSSVAIQHRKLTSQADRDRQKRLWAQRMDTLARML